MAFKLNIGGIRFDSAAILKAVDKAERGRLAAGGALIRTIQQQSMRYGNRPSAPGQPPTAHRGGNRFGSGPFLRKFVAFAFDTSTRSVVTGPAKLGRGLVPRLMEEGGTVRRRVWERVGNRPGAPMTGKKIDVSVTVKARPSAGPALRKASPKLAGVWADSVKP